MNPLRDLGPCEVLCGVILSEAKIGETHGGVRFSYKTAAAPVMEDSKGVTPQDMVFVGIEECQVTVPLGRVTLQKLSSVLPGTTYSAGASGEDNLLYGHDHVGYSGADNAMSLILKPIVNGVASTDSQEWLHLPKCAPMIADSEITYDESGQRVFNVRFVSFPKTGTIGANSKNIYWHIGAADQITWS